MGGSAGTGNPWVTITVALIAATAALIGAAVAATSAKRRQIRELAHDRQLADVTELRSVLDEAAVNISRASRAMAQIESLLTASRPPTDAAEATLAEATDEVSKSAQRIRIRVGEGEVQHTFNRVNDACNRYRDMTTRSASTGGREADPNANYYESFSTASDDFFAAAYRVVGVAP